MKKVLSLLLVVIITVSSIVVGNITVTAKSKSKKKNISNYKKYGMYVRNWFPCQNERGWDNILTKTFHYVFDYSEETKNLNPKIAIGKGYYDYRYKKEFNPVFVNLLKKGKDYTISKIKPLKAGEIKKVTIKGKGKYKGKRTFYYGVRPLIKGYIKVDSYLNRFLYVLPKGEPYTIIKGYFKTSKNIQDECMINYKADIQITLKRSKLKIVKSGKYKGYYYFKRKLKNMVFEQKDMSRFYIISSSTVAQNWMWSISKVKFKYTGHVDG